MRTEKLRSYQHIEQDTYRTFEYIHIFLQKKKSRKRIEKNKKKWTSLVKSQILVCRERENSQSTPFAFILFPMEFHHVQKISSPSHTHTLFLFFYIIWMTIEYVRTCVVSICLLGYVFNELNWIAKTDFYIYVKLHIKKTQIKYSIIITIIICGDQVLKFQ